MNWDNSTLIHVAKVNNLRYGCNFIATNDEYVWKDTPNESSGDAVFRNKENMAKTIPFDYVSDVSWTSIQVLPGYHIRKKNEPDTESIGDTIGEALNYIEFDEVYKIDRPSITESETINEQIKDIVRYHTGAVHTETVYRYLNKENLDKDYSLEDIQSTMNRIKSDEPIYQTRQSEKWWSIR